MPLLRRTESRRVERFSVFVRKKYREGFIADIVREVRRGSDERCGVWYELADSARPQHRIGELVASLQSYLCLDVAGLIAEYTMDVFVETDFIDGNYRLPRHHHSRIRGGTPCGWHCAPRVTADMLKLCFPKAPLRYDEPGDDTRERRPPFVATTREQPL